LFHSLKCKSKIWAFLMRTSDIMCRVLSDAQVMQPPQRHNPQPSRMQEPVVSICQFVQMRLDLEEAGFVKF
jgi:hypothetical protein